jgi:hypothetical protein
VAVSNAVTAGQRLLSEPPNRRGDVESSLAAVNYCRRILHALAAISDYPTREPIQLESDDLTRLIEALAKALDDLAASLEKGTVPGRLPDSSEILERLEKDLQIAPRDFQKVSDVPVGNPKNSETGAWLFYHLKNVYNLTLAAREAVSRLLSSEGRSAAQWQPQLSSLSCSNVEIIRLADAWAVSVHVSYCTEWREDSRHSINGISVGCG